MTLAVGLPASLLVGTADRPAPGAKTKGRFEANRQTLMLLLIAGGIYLMMGDRGEALVLLGFVAIIMGITVFQERRTDNALVALRDLSSPRALVVRDGERRRIPGREVVRGDVIVLLEGDRVPAEPSSPAVQHAPHASTGRPRSGSLPRSWPPRLANGPRGLVAQPIPVVVLARSLSWYSCTLLRMLAVPGFDKLRYFSEDQ